MSVNENREVTFDAINYVTIPIWEYKDLVTKVSRYELLQEQEKQQKAELEAFRANLANEMRPGIVFDGEPEPERPVPVTVKKSKTVKKPQTASDHAIRTEIVEK